MNKNPNRQVNRAIALIGKTERSRIFYSLLLVLSLTYLYACQKGSKKEITDSAGGGTELNALWSAPPDATKSMHFSLQDFTIEAGSSLLESPGYEATRDTALVALKIVSDIFSSQEFKDSISTYQFDPSKATTCKGLSNPIPSKVDPASQMIPGITVYNDLLGEENAKINLSIKKRSEGFGSAYPCFGDEAVPTIWTYDWFLVSRPKKALEYALNIAHEFTHTRGYVHASGGGLDVPETVAGIVRHIYQRKRIEQLRSNPAPLDQRLGSNGFKVIQIDPDDLPDLSPMFNTAYQTANDLFTLRGSASKIEYLSLQFLSDQRMRLWFKTWSTSGQYNFLTFDYMVVQTKTSGKGDVFKFVYTGNTNAFRANQDATQTIRQYFERNSFKIAFMDEVKRPPVYMVAGLLPVSNPKDFTYGVIGDGPVDVMGNN